MEPSWDQMPPKPDPKADQKKYHFLGALRSDFWWILAPKSRFPICLDRSHVGSWGHLGAKMGPRRPKKPQEAPKTASKTDFGLILVDFWLFFRLFFGCFGGSCRLLLLVVVMVCCLVGLLVCWSVGLVALLVFWFVGCLFVGCLAPESKARGRVARRAVRSGAPSSL